jgi:hypothetical protein
VFEKRVLRNIFGPQRDEATGAGEDCIMSTSSNIVRVIKSGRMRWARHVACGMCETEKRCIEGFGGET